MNTAQKPPEITHEELPTQHPDPLISFLHLVIRVAVKVLAVLMALIIIFSVVDVIYVFYVRLSAPPIFMLGVRDIFQLFGTIMVALIAIEIFVNVRLYLGTDVLPVRLVVATALMAVARKVIILDLDEIEAEYVFGIAAIALSFGITYWLLSKKI